MAETDVNFWNWLRDATDMDMMALPQNDPARQQWEQADIDLKNASAYIHMRRKLGMDPRDYYYEYGIEETDNETRKRGRDDEFDDDDGSAAQKYQRTGYGMLSGGALLTDDAYRKIIKEAKRINSVWREAAHDNAGLIVFAIKDIGFENTKDLIDEIMTDNGFYTADEVIKHFRDDVDRVLEGELKGERRNFMANKPTGYGMLSGGYSSAFMNLPNMMNNTSGRKRGSKPQPVFI